MFFQRFLDQAAFDALLVASEKTFVKSPETGFVALSATIPHIASFSLGPYASTKLLAPVLLHAKSTKAEVRTAAVSFFAALVAKLDQDLEAGAQAEAAILDEMLALIKSGKTANADHRISLYSMIRFFPASPATAAKVVAILPAQIAKETTSEPALVSLLQTLSTNLAVTLAANEAIPAAAMTALQKELASPKAATRRAVVVCVGDTLWTLGESPERWTEQADKFAEVAGKTLADVSLKNVSANALTAAAGVGEGFVAAAVLLGPLSRSKSAAISEPSLPQQVDMGSFADRLHPPPFLQRPCSRRTPSSKASLRPRPSRPSCCGRRLSAALPRPRRRFGSCVVSRPLSAASTTSSPRTRP